MLPLLFPGRSASIFHASGSALAASHCRCNAPLVGAVDKELDFDFDVDDARHSWQSHPEAWPRVEPADAILKEVEGGRKGGETSTEEEERGGGGRYGKQRHKVYDIQLPVFLIHHSQQCPSLAVCVIAHHIYHYRFTSAITIVSHLPPPPSFRLINHIPPAGLSSSSSSLCPAARRPFSISPSLSTKAYV
ncbi:hypothetical protein CBR_g3240 [Chara braunii]|uniref:Uncharacterized protein n=1 Tax=Chara braunii TaxID=69332 RepID=A0A388KF68_CHABU|nr:hypothetical protein CBR_g3240 [Chara braunii]|eukprot:GBG68698.1 hypothetical protein CBR_g3240 [Chara braunii]